MAGLILFNKPYQVLSQFTDSEARTTLSRWLEAPGYRAAGRLDYDSEGLLLLTDDGRLQHQITAPARKTWKTYWAQLEGIPDETALAALRQGVKIGDGMTRPARAELIEQPAQLWPRDPPIRERRKQATCWLQLQIREGRNRQVRRMTAAVGHPTLRLIRQAVAGWTLDGLAPGEYRTLQVHMPQQKTMQRRIMRGHD